MNPYVLKKCLVREERDRRRRQGMREGREERGRRGRKGRYLYSLPNHTLTVCSGV